MEVWRDIKGFEGRYQVSNLGRVKSLARRMNDKQFIMILKLMFGNGHLESYEVIDNKSGITKAGFRSTKVKEYPDGDVDYRVTINKNILDRWLREANE